MIGIYKITSPSNKIYIGQSTDINKRWEQHRRSIKSKKITKLINSFKKYSVEKHIFEVIEECNSEDLNIRERYWQDFYNVLEDGLNLILTETNTEVRKRVLLTEHKLNISKSLMGNVQLEESRIKRSESKKGNLYWKNKNKDKNKNKEVELEWGQF